MLASITFEAGVVTATGSSSADDIVLFGNDDFQTFSVTIINDVESTITEIFNRSEVDRVIVFAGDGDDRVTNTLLTETVINGEGGNDNLQGGFLNDSLFGGLGNDILIGRNGDDFLSGQGGNDTLHGVNGDDDLVGSDGNDFVSGGAGNDTLNGGSGLDRLFGRDGDDLIHGADGDDIIIGGLGNDMLMGDSGNDLINGNEGDDTIVGGFGDDTVNGGRGADEIFGNNGEDTLFGNGGDDTINGGAHDDAIRGGSGEDRLIGGNGDDNVTGSAGNDFIAGNAGNDWLNGGSGNDSLFGGLGNDGLTGSSGNDLNNGGEGIDNSFHFSNQFDHRITEAGENFRVTDFRIQDASFIFETGSDLLIDVETVDFTDFEPTPIEEVVLETVAERIFVQPILVSDTNGSNRSAFFGPPAEEAETIARINRIFNQAEVEVQFLEEVQFNNTFVNSGSIEDRPASDLAEIISLGEAAGVVNSNPNVINIFFVQNAPETALSSISPVNAALLNDNGVVLEAVELRDSVGSRRRNAYATVQGIARNLGLTPTPGANNVLNPEILGIGSSALDLDPFLTQSQSEQIIESAFTRSI